MAGTYRALLIGNSVYPADEHNLQPLKGPPKDISALNRALIDDDTGLFADTEVTLLPEASSVRALRALSRFFGGAQRDDVVLLYFSGHGKLDQLGRLYLCMQDTDTGDLLATSISSVRINEFADASRARNVVIVLRLLPRRSVPRRRPGQSGVRAGPVRVDQLPRHPARQRRDGGERHQPLHPGPGRRDAGGRPGPRRRRVRQLLRRVRLRGPAAAPGGPADPAAPRGRRRRSRRRGGRRLGSPPLPLRPEDAARPPVPGRRPPSWARSGRGNVRRESWAWSPSLSA